VVSELEGLSISHIVARSIEIWSHFGGHSQKVAQPSPASAIFQSILCTRATRATPTDPSLSHRCHNLSLSKTFSIDNSRFSDTEMSCSYSRTALKQRAAAKGITAKQFDEVYQVCHDTASFELWDSSEESQDYMAGLWTRSILCKLFTAY
jgi:hypothetical protein